MIEEVSPRMSASVLSTYLEKEAAGFLGLPFEREEGPAKFYL